MDKGKYGKERRIRRKYRRISIRRTRGYIGYPYKGERRWLRRSVEMRRRRMLWRTRIPGRYKNEWRKVQEKTRRRTRRRSGRTRMWYESERDVGRNDRRISRRYMRPRRIGRIYINGKKRSEREYKGESLENRKRRRGRRRVCRRWTGIRDGVIEGLDTKEIGKEKDIKRSRIEGMKERNRRRWRIGTRILYRRWTEAIRRIRYRYKGRKRGKKE